MSQHRVQHQFTFLVAICTTMKPQGVVNRAKNQPLTNHQFFKRRESSICRLHPAAQLAGVTREGRSCLAFDAVVRPLVLSPVLGFVGGSRLFFMTVRRVESLREHNDVSDLRYAWVQQMTESGTVDHAEETVCVQRSSKRHVEETVCVQRSSKRDAAQWQASVRRQRRWR